MKAAGRRKWRGIRYVPDQHTGGGRCAACGGRIVWARTDIGRYMPIDAQAVISGGAWVLWHDEPPASRQEEETRVSSLTSFQARTGKVYEGQLWTSHYATCPELRKQVAPVEARQLELIKGGLS